MYTHRNTLTETSNTTDMEKVNAGLISGFCSRGANALRPNIRRDKWNKSAQCVRKHAHLEGFERMFPQKVF